MDVSKAKRQKSLEGESGLLKRTLTGATLDTVAMKDLLDRK